MSIHVPAIAPFLNKGLTAAWLLAIAGTFFLASTLESKTSQFYGTAGSREQLISFQYPVEIVQVPVVEGQAVALGTHLLEVRRSDLAASRAIIEDQIMETQIRERESLAATIAQLGSLRAQQQTRLVEIDTQIKSLESRYTLNRRLLQGVSANSTTIADDAESSAIAVIGNNQSNPLLAEVAGLTESRHYIRDSFQIQIDNLTEQLTEAMRPARAQLAELDERRADLDRQQADLVVNAQFSGNVGSVLQKPGEQVAPFNTIMSIHGSSPSFIKGYISEDVINDVQPGRAVWIKSQSAHNSSQLVEGVVESIGSRIVEFPDRLRSNPLVTTWGREVIVFPSSESSLLLGEKVLVLLEPPESPGAFIGQLFRAALAKIRGQSYSESLSNN